eukprot:1158502-Pelagomonas_calceolata.AAC.6
MPFWHEGICAWIPIRLMPLDLNLIDVSNDYLVSGPTVVCDCVLRRTLGKRIFKWLLASGHMLA